jgi:hypothetical protein
MTDDTIPTSPEGYAAVLPDNPAFAGAKIDVNDPRFKAAREAAHASRLTRAEFTTLLGVEAARAMRSAGHKAAAVPATPRKIPGYAKMTMAEKLNAYGHTK